MIKAASYPAQVNPSMLLKRKKNEKITLVQMEGCPMRRETIIQMRGGVGEAVWEEFLGHNRGDGGKLKGELVPKGGSEVVETPLKLSVSLIQIFLSCFIWHAYVILDLTAVSRLYLFTE